MKRGMVAVLKGKYGDDNLLKEKHFLLVAATVFTIFILLTGPSFYVIITYTKGFIQQAFAQENGEVIDEEPTGEVVDELPPPPTEEPPTEEPPLTPPPPRVEPLTASFSIVSTNGDTAPATFLFEADIQGGTEPYTIIWNFGDGSPQGSGISIHHTYEQAGTYDVTLAVRDSTAPTPQDISVSRQVTVRPATTTDEIALPSSTNATTTPPTPLVNQTTPTNDTESLIVCRVTTAGIICPTIPATDQPLNVIAVPLTNETNENVTTVEYRCFTGSWGDEVLCSCKGIQDCVDLEHSGRCDGGIFIIRDVGTCWERKDLWS